MLRLKSTNISCNIDMIKAVEFFWKHCIAKLSHRFEKHLLLLIFRGRWGRRLLLKIQPLRLPLGLMSSTSFYNLVCFHERSYLDLFFQRFFTPASCCHVSTYIATCWERIGNSDFLSEWRTEWMDASYAFLSGTKSPAVLKLVHVIEAEPKFTTDKLSKLCLKENNGKIMKRNIQNSGPVGT